jgi:hypothetical protein
MKKMEDVLEKDANAVNKQLRPLLSGALTVRL